jgi:DNA-directed RNA polymerase subunit RPC12/RpoP
MSIAVVCPSCRQKLRAPDTAAGRNTKCPKCGSAIVVQAPSHDHIQPPQPPPLRQPISSAQPAPKLPISSPKAVSLPLHRDSKSQDNVPETRAYSTQLDPDAKIALSAAGVGLLLLAISPLFKWINFGSGGVIGLSGDGKIVLAITLFAIGISVAAFVKQKCLTPVLLGVQAWGTVAAFWMGGLIWKVASVFDSAAIKDNPFAGLLAIQVSPGAGLYLGLFGAIVVAGAFGFIAVRRLLMSGSIRPYCASQALSCVIGILLVVLVGPDVASKSDTMAEGDPQSPWSFPGINVGTDRVSAQATWRQRHNVSDAQWEAMIATYTMRKHPQSVTQTDWWEEAKDKTPADLDDLYPPLQPREWYRAEWTGGFSRSRELDYSVTARRQDLKVSLVIRTEPDLPIKELHGHLAFIKEGEVIYETELTEKPNVSFTDRHFVFLRVQYDDSNANHRTLRFAKDSELTPVFNVRKVLLADGEEKTFD